MTKNRKSHMTVLRLAAILLIMVMLSTSMIAGRYARYTTTATGSDGARTAKYQITVSSVGSDDSLVLVPGTPAEYAFSVTSSSEVSVEYDLVIILPKELPDGISISLAGENGDVPLTPKENQYTAEKAGTFDTQGGTHAYTLTFAAVKPVGADKLNGISIRVDARQVD